MCKEGEIKRNALHAALRLPYKCKQKRMKKAKMCRIQLRFQLHPFFLISYIVQIFFHLIESYDPRLLLLLLLLKMVGAQKKKKRREKKQTTEVTVFGSR